MEKRGQLSMETIIIIILALIVLVVVAAAFSGGMAALWKKIIGISETYTQADVDAAKSACNTACQLGNKDTFCTQKFPLVGDQTCRGLGVSCTNPLVVC
jgi:uncharacterized protein (UPF0333 family)